MSVSTATAPSPLRRAARRGGAWQWRAPLAALAVASGLALLWEGHQVRFGTSAGPDDRGLWRVMLCLSGMAALAFAALLERDGLGRGRRGWALIGLVAILYAGGAVLGIYDDRIYGMLLTLVVLLCGSVAGPGAFLLWPPLAMSVGAAHGMVLGIDAESPFHGTLGGCLAGLVLVPPILGLYGLVRRVSAARPRLRWALAALFAGLLLLFLAWLTWDLVSDRNLERLRRAQFRAGYPTWPDDPDLLLSRVEKARQDALEAAIYGFREGGVAGVSAAAEETLRRRGFACLLPAERTQVLAWFEANAHVWVALERSRGAELLWLGSMSLRLGFTTSGLTRVQALAEAIAARTEERAAAGAEEAARAGISDLLRLTRACEVGDPYRAADLLAANSAGVALRRLAVQTLARSVPVGVDAGAARAWRECLQGVDPGPRPVRRAAELLLREWKQTGWLRLLAVSPLRGDGLMRGLKRPRVCAELGLSWEWLRGVIEATGDGRPPGPVLPRLAAPPASWFGVPLATPQNVVLRGLAAEVDGLRATVAVARRGLELESAHAECGSYPMAAEGPEEAEVDPASGVRIGVVPEGGRVVALDAAGGELAAWELRRGR